MSAKQVEASRPRMCLAPLDTSVLGAAEKGGLYTRRTSLPKKALNGAVRAAG